MSASASPLSPRCPNRACWGRVRPCAACGRRSPRSADAEQCPYHGGERDWQGDRGPRRPSASPRHAQAFVPINCGAIPEALLGVSCSDTCEGPSPPRCRPVLDCSLRPIAAPSTWTKSGTCAPHAGEAPAGDRREIVWAVGSTKPVLVDARIIASTNRDLVKEIEGGRFPRRPLLPPQRGPHRLPRCGNGARTWGSWWSTSSARFNLKLSTKFLGVDRGRCSAS